MASFDIGGLITWAANQGLGKLEQRIGLPLTEALAPVIKRGVEHFGLSEALELDMPMLVLTKLAMAGIARQKELEQQRRAADDTRNHS